MSIITVERATSTVVPSSAPFRVVTDQKYIAFPYEVRHGFRHAQNTNLAKVCNLLRLHWIECMQKK
jgi:hypothetical protein